MSIHKISSYIITVMRKYQIRSRILILLIVFTILPTQLVLLITKNNITNSFTNLKSSYWEISQKTIENNLANMLNQVDFCAYQILNDGVIFNALNTKSMQYRSRYSYLCQTLKSIADHNSQVEKITIVANTDEQFNSDFNVDPYLNCSMLSFVNTLPVIIQTPTKSLISGNNIQVRTLIDFSTGISYGYLCIFIDDSAIYNSYKNVISDHDKCMIINSTGQVVFNDIKNTAIPVIFENHNEDNASAFFSKKLKISSTPTLDWYLICSFSNQELKKSIKHLNQSIIIVQLFILIISILSIWKMSNKLTFHIRHLHSEILSYSHCKDYKIKCIDAPHDELSFLETSLNNMIDQNNRLIHDIEINQQKQRDLELQIMQAQINPHFIYNTIDSVSCLAQKKGEHDIRTILLALANFFRFSLSKGSKYVTVRDELQHVKYYASIEQFRSNNAFNISYDVAPEILDKKIIKVILQPLVENSIHHGLKNHIGIGHIKVCGFMLDDKLHFEVTDDGTGFDPSILDDKEYSGFGYKNINERIKLEYGNEYGLTYYSIPGNFTRAELTIGFLPDETT